MDKYSFKIVMTRPTHISETTRSIYVSGVCIIAKNSKFSGALYQSKYIKKVWGKFRRVAGSNSYPVLSPLYEKATILVTNFPNNPKLETVKENIEIIDVKKHQTIQSN